MSYLNRADTRVIDELDAVTPGLMRLAGRSAVDVVGYYELCELRARTAADEIGELEDILASLKTKYAQQALRMGIMESSTYREAISKRHES